MVFLQILTANFDFAKCAQEILFSAMWAMHKDKKMTNISTMEAYKLVEH
jgi:hypothetical protein